MFMHLNYSRDVLVKLVLPFFLNYAHSVFNNKNSLDINLCVSVCHIVCVSSLRDYICSLFVCNNVLSLRDYLRRICFSIMFHLGYICSCLFIMMFILWDYLRPFVYSIFLFWCF